MDEINSNKLLQIALDENDEFVSIYNVKTGLDCNSKCPNCKCRLVAKNKGKTSNEALKPNEKLAHFAHYNAPECIGASESAIHLLAKEIILERRKLLLPSTIFNREVLVESKFIEFDEVILEKIIKVGDKYIKPDAILVKNKTELFIEFYKTHFVDDEKIEKIKWLGTSCLEIDLNLVDPLINGEINKEGIIELLEKEEDSKFWLNNAKIKLLLENAKEKEKEKKKDEKEKLKLQQEKEYEEERKDFLEKLKSQKRISDYIIRSEAEKKMYLEMGIKIIKVYDATVRHTGIVYCPKEKSIGNKNEKVDLSECRKCCYYFKDFSDGFVKGGDYHNGFILQTVACGFHKKLTK